MFENLTTNRISDVGSCNYDTLVKFGLVSCCSRIPIDTKA